MSEISETYEAQKEYSVALRKLYLSTEQFISNQDYESAYLEILKGFEIPIRISANYNDLHYFLEDCTELLYMASHYSENWERRCIELCNKDIEILQHYCFPYRRLSNSITRKCIILERMGLYNEAIAVCDLGTSLNLIDRSYYGSFAERKERLSRKIEKNNGLNRPRKKKSTTLKIQTRFIPSPKINIDDITEAIPDCKYQYNRFITDKNFVFTGQLKNMEREEAYAAVISRGGNVKSGISQKVNYLVNADPTATTTKLKNAYDLQAQGYPIQIITDEEFMKMLEVSPSETNAPKPIDYDTLTVIDFEVANEQFSSACALGVVVLHKGEIVERQYHLIKPPENRYLQSTIDIHGITPEQTENAETFPQVWQKIKKFFQNTVVAAHNAVFDMAVLKATLKHYGITQPNFVYCCSIMISNLAIPYEENVRGTLDERCKYFDVPLPTHHHAMCDAEAAANIILQSFRKIASSDFSDFLAKQVSLKPFKEVKNSAVIGFVQRAQSDEPIMEKLNIL